jgi:dolichol-phosphate mannosyltransferase
MVGMPHAVSAPYEIPASAGAVPFLDVIVPVHNEEKSIEASLLELSQLLAQRLDSYRLIVCEDGSTDKTLLVVKRLSEHLPIQLVSGPTRKGYGRAVVDGMRTSTADLCAVIEGDGQTDPASIAILLERVADFDVCVGCRTPRSDNLLRKILSRSFRCLYRALLGVKLTDPSYACIVIRRNALRYVLRYLTNRLSEGAFWEFHAWTHALQLRVAEFSVPHRIRRDGKSRVFPVRRLPSITAHNVIGLLGLRQAIRHYQQQARMANGGGNGTWGRI